MVSLVSEQTIPNIQLIKEFEMEMDEFVFITTEMMEEKDENRTDWIISSIQISKDKTARLLVHPHDLHKIEDALENFNFKPENEYYINLTGGTKLMTIAAMNFFRNLPNVFLYYVPKGSDHYLEIFPQSKRMPKRFNCRVTLYEYLTAYGLKIESKETLHKPVKETRQLMQKVLDKYGDLDKLPEIKRARDYKSNEDKKYYSGGWFEEYVFSSIKYHFELRDKEIAVGVKIQDKFAKNEFDVVFIKNNIIYVLECKAYFGDSKLKTKIEKDLYKLSALDDDFGIEAHSIYATTIDLERGGHREYKSIINRAEDLGVKLFHFPDFVDDRFLESI